MISKQELLMGRDKTYAKDYTDEISKNVDELLVVLNKVRAAYGKPMTVSSGWRPAAINSNTSGSAKSSLHMQGLACDFRDDDRSIMKWVLNNLQLMQDLGIYIEDFRWTKNWCHMGIRAPASKNRIFVPSSAPAIDPTCWDGKYDKKFNG